MYRKTIMASLSTLLATSGSVNLHNPLPSLPQLVAGQFVGSLDDAVVIAGGSWWKASDNSTMACPTKIWEKNVLSLPQGEEHWYEIALTPTRNAQSSAARCSAMTSTGKNEPQMEGRSWVWSLQDLRCSAITMLSYLVARTTQEGVPISFLQLRIST